MKNQRGINLGPERFHVEVKRPSRCQPNTPIDGTISILKDIAKIYKDKAMNRKIENKGMRESAEQKNFR